MKRSESRSESEKGSMGGISQSPSTPTKSGKLPVAEPASVAKFFLVLVMHTCKRVLINDTAKLAWLYILAVTIISLLTDLFPLPNSYFSDKHNIWNKYFVKLGWGWTLAAVAPFIYCTSFVVSLGNMTQVWRHLTRLFLPSVCWFAVTSSTSYLETYTGTCSVNSTELKTYGMCLQNGGKWIKWLDISGHCFLLVMCIMTIAEESVVYRDWSRLSELIRKEDKNYFKHLSSAEVDTLKSHYDSYTPLVRCLFGFMAFLQVLWNVMLFCTSLYFHTMPDKFLGVLLGLICWTLCYRMMLQVDNSIPRPLDLAKQPFKDIKRA